jgi:dipeptidyl aminopeptidase/acylaminoacyl peptidase
MSNPSVPLIPRKVLFGNPDRASAQISPDGAHLAWLAPREGVLNVWVAPREDPSAARAVTNDTGRGIRFYTWAYTGDHILYIQDQNGDENWRLYAAAIRSDDIRDLTPFERTQARIIATSERYPEEVMVGLNNRQPEWHDLYRINVVTGELKLVQENDRFMGFVLDDDYRLRFGLQMTPEGSIDIYRHGEGDWQPWDTIPPEDILATDPRGFDKTGRLVYFSDSRGRNTAALVEVDTETMHKRVLAEDSRADVSDIVRHPTGKHVQAVSFIYERKQWQVLDPAIEGDLAYLSTVADGEVAIVSRTLDDRYWTVLFVVDSGPARYYLYDRNAREASYLFSNRAALEGQPLVKMFPVVIPSRDGLDLVAYYSLPAGSDADGDGVPDQPLPMVLIPHGGPWSRDFWGYNPHHQWLTNRDYAVLNVNFRSSTGFGKSFTNAGDHEWGGRIREDQVDAVQWAIAQKIADPARVAILGGSFGGYSVLAGLTFTPELFACGVDLVGPSNLITLLESVPPYWKPMLEMFTTRVGDFRTEEGRALLKAHSPLTYADRICRPLLIGQGANDPRVKQAESDQIVQAMQANGIPVTYLLYPDEGHGFARPENHISFNAVAESFLARCLGGRAEPIGDDFRGASLKLLAGAEEVPGLAEAMAGRNSGQK